MVGSIVEHVDTFLGYDDITSCPYTSVAGTIALPKQPFIIFF